MLLNRMFASSSRVLFHSTTLATFRGWLSRYGYSTANGECELPAILTAASMASFDSSEKSITQSIDDPGLFIQQTYARVAGRSLVLVTLKTDFSHVFVYF